MLEEVITRFAPSPTGNLHIGGARTALFNYLWAKKNNGKFILRIEDTDRARYRPESEKSIIDGLKWLGLNWDLGPIKQSENFKNYKKHADQLVEQGKAYYCFCTAERLEKMREIQKKKNLAPKYDGICKKFTSDEIAQKIKNKDPYVIRLKVPEQGSIAINDLIRGRIKFDCREIDDQVLIKSDGFPTYHLANVVDDHEMGVTCVIRGEEWIPSTPKHVLLYQAFGWQLPQFAHLSLFIKKDGGKLSKREGAASLLNYRDDGYLPEAVNNFIAFLGWNPKNKQEFFSLEELIKEFDLKNVNKANPIFDTAKLDYLNGCYLRKKTIDEFMQLAEPYLPANYQTNKDYLKQILKIEQERVKKLSDLANLIAYFFNDKIIYDQSLLIWKDLPLTRIKSNLESLMKKISSLTQWGIKDLENSIISWIKEKKLSNGEVLWPMRVALSGLKASPSPFEISAIIGKEKTLQRIQKAIDLL